MKPSQTALEKQASPSGRRSRSRPAPLSETRLEELALAYVARFATSAGRLRAYCRRKLRERGYEGAEDDAAPPDVEALVARFVAKGYVDDAGFARAKRDDLLRRGYGARRVGDALRADGIAEDLRERVAPGETARREAVIAYARRRRFGPFARDDAPLDPAQRQKQLAAMLRAGHSFGDASQVLDSPDGAELADWLAETEDADRC